MSLLGEMASYLGLSYAENALNGSKQKRDEKRAIEQSKELAKYQSDINYANWLKQQEYNTPLEQIKRMRAAGLNPAMMYEGITADTGNANNAPESGNVSQSMQSYTGLRQYQLQSQMLESQIDNIQANTEKTKQEASKTNEETKGIKVTNSFLPDVYNQQLQLGESNIKFNYSGTFKNYQDARLAQQSCSKVLADIESIRENVKYLRAQENLLDSQTALNKQAYAWNPKLWTANISKIKSDIHLNAHQAQYFDELGKVADSQVDINQKQLDLMDVNYKFLYDTLDARERQELEKWLNLNQDTLNKGIQGQQMSLQFENDLQFQVAERYMNLFKTSAETFNLGVSSIDKLDNMLIKRFEVIKDLIP